MLNINHLFCSETVQVYNVIKRIKLMSNLESKDMPLRTNKLFYEPQTKQRSSSGIKVFPNLYSKNKDNFLTPKGDSSTILSYLAGLNAAKQLPRRIYNRHEYYKQLKNCSKHTHKTINPESNNYEQTSLPTRQSRFDTLLSSHPNNQSVLDVLCRKKKQMERIKEEQSKLKNNEEGEKQMRFTFYNTIEKSSYFFDRFKEDSSLSFRRTNNFQNMMRRAITTEKILYQLSKSKEKLKMGQL